MPPGEGSTMPNPPAIITNRACPAVKPFKGVDAEKNHVGHQEVHGPDERRVGEERPLCAACGARWPARGRCPREMKPKHLGDERHLAQAPLA